MTIVHFLLYNGIGQNITATGILGVPAYFKWIRPHIKRQKEIHKLLLRMHIEKQREIQMCNRTKK